MKYSQSMISSTPDGDYFYLKMNYQDILHLQCFEISTKVSIQILENI